MDAFLNCVSFIFEVKISFVNRIYIRSRIRQLMNQSLLLVMDGYSSHVSQRINNLLKRNRIV